MRGLLARLRRWVARETAAAAARRAAGNDVGGGGDNPGATLAAGFVSAVDPNGALAGGDRSSNVGGVGAGAGGGRGGDGGASGAPRHSPAVAAALLKMDADVDKALAMARRVRTRVDDVAGGSNGSAAAKVAALVTAPGDGRTRAATGDGVSRVSASSSVVRSVPSETARTRRPVRREMKRRTPGLIVTATAKNQTGKAYL